MLPAVKHAFHKLGANWGEAWRKAEHRPKESAHVRHMAPRNDVAGTRENREARWDEQAQPEHQCKRSPQPGAPMRLMSTVDLLKELSPDPSIHARSILAK